MMKKTLLSCLVCCFALGLAAQDLYMPRNIKAAYKKGTRSMDGKPGKNYWQNTARYAIDITVAPPDRLVKGKEDIVYTNHSPDTLSSIVIRLVLNIHRKGAARGYPAYDNYLTSGVHVDRYLENGKPSTFNDPEGGTTTTLGLSKSLAPGDSVKLSFEWHFDLSIQSGREGCLDETTFYLAYFYPRVAVLDDYNGWDHTPFTDEREFYNDFNDYTLSVNVPDNYVVWSTGDLLNPEEVLQPEIAARLKRSFTADTVLSIASFDELKSKAVTAHHDQNTWRWKASNVSDMTVNISDHYIWDAASVQVDDNTKRRASVQSAYTMGASDFREMVGFGQHALDWLSHNWPGVPYPFPKTTIVQGFADMEYPMMVNDQSQEDMNTTRFIVEHELAHTWFPFYMGINETRYGFMDEGWTTAFEYMICSADMGKEREDAFFRRFRVRSWINDLSAEEQIPIVTPGNALTGAGLGHNEYGKPALGYLAVKDLLGDDEFRKCLHGFMDRWNGKHPMPWDMFYSFNDLAGKNLNWFWNNWFFSNGYIDLSIRNVEEGTDKLKINLDNIGGFAIPFDVVVTYEGGTVYREHKTPAVWEVNQTQTSVEVKISAKPKSVVIDGGIYIDADESNNRWEKE